MAKKPKDNPGKLEDGLRRILIDAGAKREGETASVGEDFPIHTTQPDHLLRHNISDEELTMLGNTNRDGLGEVIWACLGIGIGGLISVFRSVKAAYWTEPRIPLDAPDLLEVVICGVALALFIVLFFLSRKRGQSYSDLATIIRNRTAKKTKSA